MMKRKWRGEFETRANNSFFFFFFDDLLIEDQSGPKQQTHKHNELPKGRGVTQYTTSTLLSSIALYFSPSVCLTICRNSKEHQSCVHTTVPPERWTLTGALPVSCYTTFTAVSASSGTLAPCVLPLLLRILRSLFLLSPSLSGFTQRGMRERKSISFLSLYLSPQITP